MTRSEYKEMMSKVKSQLKGWADQIKVLKSQRKGAPNGVVSGLWRLRYDFRHYHIVYCELRGRSRDEIEQPSSDNIASEAYITKIYKELEVNLDEVIRAYQERLEHPTEGSTSGTCDSRVSTQVS